MSFFFCRHPAGIPSNISGPCVVVRNYISCGRCTAVRYEGLPCKDLQQATRCPHHSFAALTALLVLCAVLGDVVLLTLGGMIDAAADQRRKGATTYFVFQRDWQTMDSNQCAAVGGRKPLGFDLSLDSQQNHESPREAKEDESLFWWRVKSEFEALPFRPFVFRS